MDAQTRAVYWALYGPWFGVGLAVLILVHELGHLIEVRRRGMAADLPMFIPGFGAYVRWNAAGVTPDTRALVSLAGPCAGALAALGCALILAAVDLAGRRRGGIPGIRQEFRRSAGAPRRNGLFHRAAGDPWLSMLAGALGDALSCGGCSHVQPAR